MHTKKQTNTGRTHFKKGVSGNPNGRPKGIKMIPELLRSLQDGPVDQWLLAKLHAQYGPTHNPKTLREAMLLAAIKDAAQGDQMARSFVAERTEGKVTDRIEVEDVNVTHDNVVSVQTNKLLAFAEILAGGAAKTTRIIKRN